MAGKSSHSHQGLDNCAQGIQKISSPTMDSPTPIHPPGWQVWHSTIGDTCKTSNWNRVKGNFPLIKANLEWTSRDRPYESTRRMHHPWYWDYSMLYRQLLEKPNCFKNQGTRDYDKKRSSSMRNCCFLCQHFCTIRFLTMYIITFVKYLKRRLKLMVFIIKYLLWARHCVGYFKYILWFILQKKFKYCINKARDSLLI